MRSQLTRRVFRTLVSERQLTFSKCQRLLLPCRLDVPSCRPPSRAQQRYIFGLSLSAAPSRKPLEGKPTSASLRKAQDVMTDLAKARRSKSRLPPRKKVAEAFRYFFKSQLETPRRLSRNGVHLGTEAFEYLQDEHVQQEEEEPGSLSDQDLYVALTSLTFDSKADRYRSDVKSFAYALGRELRSRYDAQGLLSLSPGHDNSMAVQDALITVLSATGGAREAWELLRSSVDISRSTTSQWVTILKGLATESLEQDYWKALQEMERAIGNLDAQSHEELVRFLADRDNVSETIRMYEMKIRDREIPTPACNIAVADFCVRNGQLQWGAPVLQKLRSIEDNIAASNSVMVWHAAMGRSMEELQTALRRPLSIENINHLLQYAFRTNKMDLVDACQAYARRRRIRFNAQTYVLQMGSELDSNDLDAAKRSWKSLLAEDPVTDESDLATINRFLAALAFSTKPDYDSLIQAVDYLLDRNAELEAGTVSGLCRFYLQREEYEEISGLLRYRIDSYPENDRKRISQEFREYILNPEIDAQRAFNAYELFRSSFPETPVEMRLQLMHSFFNRKRPDLGCLVFGHMRQREDPECRPTPEAYAQCFEGIAKCKDVDGLQMVYNMLKLDLLVYPSTRIRHGLMVAYTACEMPFSAIIDNFWKIMDSKEGPTMSSFALALRACETWIPQGAVEARRIIALMQSWNLEITKEIYLCYIGALAGQSEFENVVELIEEMDNDIGEKPDVYTIGTFYNAIPWQYRRDEVEAWATQAYPELWKELLAFGDEIDEEWDIRSFKFDRSIDIDDELLFAPGEYDPQIAQPPQVLLEAPT